MKKYLYTTLLLLLGAVAEVFPQSMIITGGNDHGIALCNKGQIFAWGYNAGNRLCLANPADAAKDIVPSPSLVNTGSLTFSQLSGGSGGHSVALSCNKVVYCWGANEKMQCGRPTSDYIEGGEPVPVYKGVTDGYNLDGTPEGDYLGNVKYISATTQASMAILDDGTGRVVIWGTNKDNIFGAPTYEPVWLTDENNQPIRNVIHITGGDDNIMLIVGDSPDALVGTVYSAGNWNGRGAAATASDAIVAPVEIGNGKGERGTGEKLTNVRTSGLSDVGGFAVDGTTGYVYGWGNAWGCMNGYPTLYETGTTYAEKVGSGEYKEISGESYLTNVKQVVGGNGNGTVVTEDGYVLYWGCNEAAKISDNKGGVIPNSDYATAASTCKTGPVFANYCAGEKGAAEVRVDDAVAIARGDLYGFMVNSNGDFYVWGSTARPGDGVAPMHVGALGIGEVEYVSTCFKKIDIKDLCDPQDLCPEAFMASIRQKCPGEKINLYSGFTPAINREDNYYFYWEKDGVPLNTSTKSSSAADRKADAFNKYEIEIVDPGVYKVIISYVGLNVPCDNCPDDSAQIEIIDMPMPIDTIITDMNCVSDPEALSVADSIRYEFTVNNKFYATGKTSWAVYKNQVGGVAVDTLEVAVGANGSFKVSGNNVTFNDNAPTDTTFSVWVEDVTKQEGIFFKEDISAKGSSAGQLSTTQPYYLRLDLFSSVALESYDLAVSVSWNDFSATVTPVIYKAETDQQGNLVAGVEYARAKPFDIEATGGSNTAKIYNFTADMGGLVLEANPARGSSYFIFFEVSNALNANGLFVSSSSAPIVSKIGTSDVTISALGKANSKTNFGESGSRFISNLVVSKLTDYTCGRIELQARLGCPPCNPLDPTSVKIEVTDQSGQPVVKNDTIFLCQESPAVTLSVSAVKGAPSAEAGAKFDILWYNKSLASTAAQTDLNKTASTFATSIVWDATKAGTSEKVFLQARDNEEPNGDCHEEDSIVIVYNEIPVAPAIADMQFCVNAAATDKPNLNDTLQTAKFSDFDVTWVTPTAMPNLQGADGATAGSKTYEYTVTSKSTGCVSAAATFDVTVLDKPVAPAVKNLDFVVTPNTTEKVEQGATATTGHTLTWYDKASKDAYPATGSSASPTVTLDAQKEESFWVAQISDIGGCISDSVRIDVTVNDAPIPTATDGFVCLGTSMDVTSLVTIGDPRNPTDNYEAVWYADYSAGKNDSISVSNVKMDPTIVGEQKFYVAQKNLSTGAISNKKEFSVFVYGVKEPALDVANVYEYCASNQMATPLKATIVEDNANGYYSSGLVWKQEVGGVYSKLTDSPRPSLDVTENTVYKYCVYQEYVINSTNEVCVGDSIDKEVSVTFVPKVVTSEVLYLKASASDGTFTKDLLEQDGNAVTDGAGNPVAAGNLQWYADDCKTPLDKTPTPELDSNVKEGDDQTGTYCVSKKVEVSDNLTCYSEPVQISYRISDALPPLVYQYYYCEGQVMDDLSAEINPQPGKNVTDYELYWYGDQKPANTKVDPIKKGETYPMDNEAAAIQNEAVTTYTYYVAQHDKTTDAVSAAQEVKIVVYPNPVVKITDPAAVCEKEVDLSTTVAVDNKDKLTGVSTFFHTYYNSDEADLKKNMVEMSGTYKIDAYYELPLPSASNVKHKDDLICRGLMEPVKVEINQLDVPVISGVSTTCPGTAVTLTAAASSIDPKTVTFEWGGDAATTAKGGTKSEKFETINLSEETGKTYTFVVTAKAGVCEKTSEEHIVEIGDGVVSGSMALNEDGNMELEGGLVFLDAAQKTTVYSCGKPVTISVEYLGDKDYVWYDENGTKVGTGSIFTTESYATYTKKTYTVKYTNQCPTSSSVTIEAIPIVAEPLSQADIDICEGEDFKVGLNYTIKEGVTPTIDWFKDDAQLGGASDKNLTVENAKAGDSGVYSYKVSNRGCSVTGTTSNVKVKPYIVASLSQIDPYIVDRHQTQTLPISYENPISGAVKYQKWYENGEEVFDGNPLVLTNVTADHKYTIVLSDPDYCDAELSAVVYVDALLQLKTELKDTMCLGTAETLVLDTTGTGNFRRPSGEPQLTIYETVGDESPININHKIVKKGDKLEIAVNPNLSAKYQISFTYNGQKEESIEEIVVIPAISLTLPPIPNICSGTETMLQVTNVQPEGTAVSWVDDPTIVEGKNSETVVVKPVFKSENSSNHQYSYIYNVVAYNSICDNSKRYQVSVLVDEPLIGEITGTAEICEGEESILEAKSYQAYEYKWRPDTAGTMTTPGVIVRPSVSTKYIVDMTRGLCSASDSFVVIVNTNPRIEKIDSVALRDRHIVLEAGYGTAPFEYQIDATDFDAKDVKTDLAFSKHVVNVRDSKGCTTSAVFTLDPPEISIPIVFTPNGDGVSDTWSIPALSEVYPNSIVSIYDRFGKLLVQFLGAEADGWDGTYNGSKLPSTDYWYLITIEEIDKEYSGHFTLIRR